MNCHSSPSNYTGTLWYGSSIKAKAQIGPLLGVGKWFCYVSQPGLWAAILCVLFFPPNAQAANFH